MRLPTFQSVSPWRMASTRVACWSASIRLPSKQAAIERVRARVRGLGEDVRVDRLAHLRAGEFAFDRGARCRQRVDGEQVMVDERVVERRERTVRSQTLAP